MGILELTRCNLGGGTQCSPIQQMVWERRSLRFHRGRTSGEEFLFLLQVLGDKAEKHMLSSLALIHGHDHVLISKLMSYNA